MKIFIKSCLFFSVMILSASCGKSCMQAVADHWTITNETNSQQTIMFDVKADDKAQPAQELTINSNISSEMTVSYSIEKEASGKIFPIDAYCSSLPEYSYSKIQLHDANANIKLCFKDSDKVYILDLATTCPFGSDEKERW
jgi:uncharacterized protein affecting Mg2+/Co2+ transport